MNTAEIAYENVDENSSPLLLQIIKTKLKGKAQQSVRFRGIETFDNLRKLLEEKFSDNRSNSHLQIELNSCRHMPNENVLSYCMRVEKLFAQVIVQA